MKIRTKLYLGAAISIGLIGVLALLSFRFSADITNQLRKAGLADELARETTELSMLTEQYLAYHLTRVEQQWESKINSLLELIKEQEGLILVHQAQTDLDSLNNSFFQLKANYEERQELIKENASQEEIDSTIILEERLAARIRLDSARILSIALRISAESRQEANAMQERSNSAVAIFAILLVSIIGTSAFFITRSVTKPIEELVRGANIIGGGNLKHRIDIKSRDETGYLGQAFNEMAEYLSKSRDELQQWGEELEGRVQERTAELEQRSQELADTNVQLEKMSRHKSEFLASMSHELRTPLNSIIGYTKLILDGLEGDISEEQQKDLQTVYRNGKLLLELINDLLDLSRIEAGKVVLSYEAFAISNFLDEVIPSVEQLAREKGLTLNYSAAPDIDSLYADKAKTRQVLINILGNAIKFTNEGSVKLNVAESESDIIFSVTDTGMGMKKEDLAVIFDSFQQVGPAQIAGYEGTGLGLAISKQFIEMQGGRIWAESELGKGSTFTFTLPKKKVASS